MTVLPSQPPGPVRRTPNVRPEYVLIALVVVLALVAAYLLFGRGSSGAAPAPPSAVVAPVSTQVMPAVATPVPKVAAARLIALAERSVRRAKWGHLVVQVVGSNGNSETEDIRGGPHVEVEHDSFDGHLAQVIIIRQVAYIEADSFYLDTIGIFPAAEAELANGWIRLVPGDRPYNTVTQNERGPKKLFPLLHPRVSGVLNDAGTEAIEIKGTVGKRNPREGDLYLADRRPYHPVQFDEVGTVHGVRLDVDMTFSDYGQRVRIVAPQPSTSWRQLATETA